MSIRARLLAALGANVFGFAANIAIQFGTVPILLYAWGPSLFGEWIIASTIPSYLAMSDIGLGSALANEMVLTVERDDRPAAVTAFQSVHVLLTFLGLPLFAAVYLLFLGYPIGPSVGITLIPERDLATFVALLTVQVWLSQQMTVVAAGFRCQGHYALGISLSNLTRLGEVIVLLGAVLGGAGPIPAAVAMVTTRMILTLGVMLVLLIKVPWLHFGIVHVRWTMLKKLLKPGLGFLMVAIAAPLNAQTPILITGALLGADAVAAFSTARVLSRSIQQVLVILHNSLWPEMSRAYGANDKETVGRLFRMGVAASLWAALLIAFVLAFGGPVLYPIETRRALAFDPLLFDLLLASMVVHAFWHVGTVVLAAINRTFGLGMAHVAANVAVIPVYLLFGKMWGVYGIAAGLMLCEILSALYIVPISFLAAEESGSTFWRTVISPAQLLTLIRSFRVSKL